MSNVHTLPAPPLPEGWHESRFADEWHRLGYLPGGATTNGWGPLLSVWREPDGTFTGAVCAEAIGEFDTLPEACAAAERAYCGCYVGRKS